MHGIEPVECSWFATGGDSFIIIAFTKIPQSHLVKVVQPDRACQAVDQLRVGCAGRYDVAEIDLEEVDVSEDVVVGDIADVDKDEEDEADEEEEGGENGKGFPAFCCGFYFGACRFLVRILRLWRRL